MSTESTSPEVPAGALSTTSLPALSLPKGGGAIRGIGEKFAANPVTGTGSMSLPIATSPSRAGFGPQLSLSYDSGAGNGPFGFGWSLSLPSITRKTDKGLPLYNDAGESDVFVLSGAEDLVPVYRQDAGEWARSATGTLEIHEDEIEGYRVRRYRPRVEGLFARIERWTQIADPANVHWRSISRDNVLTLYGSNENSRIADSNTTNSHIFSWLICETRDDKGNAVIYRYKEEDGTGVDLSNAHERNRGSRDDRSRAVNRYPKHIYYGNRRPLLDNAGHRPRFLDQAHVDSAAWMFEVVFDYLDHDPKNPGPRDYEKKNSSDVFTHPWSYRQDSFSSYRAGFEVRTTRLCHRVLMFHHFNGEENVGKDCLVRSTDFKYSSEQNPSNVRAPIYTFLQSATQTGYRRTNDGYQMKSLPPVEFQYTQPIVQETVEEVEAASLENLPIGVDGVTYQWTDLHGEGISGILTEQGGTWFYKRNISPISERSVEFSSLEIVAAKPNAALAGGQSQFMDLAGDGQPDLVMLDDPMPGLYEHDQDEGWQIFRPFTSRLNRTIRDPNLRFIDLNGDGHADVLISEDDAFVWHASSEESGFGPAQRIAKALDEEKGPRLAFADATQSIYLADLSGDGLTDLVRIRNGEICYWPNLGYGRFGAKVTMDNAPLFDSADQFDQQRIRVADIDGSGTTDIIYLHGNGIRLYFNQSGNSWSEPQQLNVSPAVSELASMAPTDLLGNGTACLVWSSPLPADARRPIRYVNLMGAQKPHLLFRTSNNLGAETVVHYAPSTKFYLQDKRDGKPWITRLPFPVHVVEKVETFDRISRNRFATRYAYHHGFFDGEEREFRGFGMVEQFDTEEIAALTGGHTATIATNVDPASYVSQVITKSWFHTGVYFARDRVSDFFAGQLNAGDLGEYYREPGLTDIEAASLGLDDEARRLYDDARAKELLLDDTMLPGDLTLEEEREACRALKGQMLRQEVYAQDALPGAAEPLLQRARTPYSVIEQNFTIRLLQPRDKNRHAVVFVHPREAITYHYERNPADPRVQHGLTLEVNNFGDVLKSVAIGYGRRAGLSTLPDDDKTRQEQLLITYTENDYTANDISFPAEWLDAYRTPLPCETRTYQLTGFAPAAGEKRFAFDDFASNNFAALTSLNNIPYQPQVEPDTKGKRLIEHVRTLFRRNDLTGPLPLGQVQSLALPFESYKLAFTPELVETNYVDSGKLPTADLANVLNTVGGYVHSEGDANWWISSGRFFYSDNLNHSAAEELAEARRHFFLPRRYRDPFHTAGVSTESLVNYDGHDLLIKDTRDAVGNLTTVATADDNGNTLLRLDYRVLQAYWVTDPNGNRTRVAFDTLGLVVGIAVMGKPGEDLGDSLDGFVTDPTQLEIDRMYDRDPHVDAPGLLQGATSRIIYDLDRFHRTRLAHPEDPGQWQPSYSATLACETHLRGPQQPPRREIQISFSFSDGFGREIQKKIQAEPEKMNGVPGPPRWVGSGWTIFNNKGKPVRKYEPFFSTTHRFEFAVQVGVSSTLFYDPVERVVATLHPNNAYEKVVFDPWRVTTYDVNDTILNAGGTSDPKQDPDVSEFFSRLPESDYLPSWHEQRLALATGDPERQAAEKAAVHRQTPTVTHLDALGRPFLTVAHNRFSRNNGIVEEKYLNRVDVDIEGNQREVRDGIEQAGDPQGRVVVRYDYDMLGNRIHQASMEAGERWILNDVAGKAIFLWDSRGHRVRTEYDPLRRPLRSFVTGADATDTARELLTERLVYGEQHPQAQMRNLRGKLYLHLDQAGSVTTDSNDFKGNPLQASRRLTKGTQYRQPIDWRTVDNDHIALPSHATVEIDMVKAEAALAPLLEDETYRSRITYDAMNRAIQMIAPRSTQQGAKRNVIQPTYNEANLLERLDVWLDHPTEPAELIDATWEPPSRAGVSNIEYDAKGQRLRIDYKNGASTSYDYDRATFRLINLRTTRSTGFNGPSQMFADSAVQDLHYTYDPVGNITRIDDAAQKTICHNNEQVDPVCEYTYDATYRLIEARGREHIGQTAFDFKPANGNQRDQPFAGLANFNAHPNDIQTLRNYTELYEYDSVGNFISMSHVANAGSWTRTYDYEEPSLIETDKQSNRLTRTTVGNGVNRIESYVHDAHGNMTRMPHLGGEHPDQNMFWDYRDQLSEVDLGGGGTAYYVYDGAGQRVRKVIETQNGTLKEERIYLGGFEVFRNYNHRGDVTLARETLHIVDDKQRIALVETRTIAEADTDPAPAQLIRYQFGNHLGSSSLELDDHAQVISYEEYTPYGSTSYQTMRSQAETPKRFRYTGKERDEESGIYYYGARYYADWIGRWLSCDPDASGDGPDLYLYSQASPINLIDLDGRFGIPWGLYLEERQRAKALEPVADAVEAGSQVAEGASGAVGDVVKGSAKEGVLRVLGPVASPIKAKETADSLVRKYDEGGGGGWGVLNAVNEFNPLYKALEAGYKTKKALEEGEYRTVGKEAVNTAVHTVATVGFVAGGVTIARGLGVGPAGPGATTAASAEASVTRAATTEAATSETAATPKAAVPKPEASPTKTTVRRPPGLTPEQEAKFDRAVAEAEKNVAESKAKWGDDGYAMAGRQQALKRMEGLQVQIEKHLENIATAEPNCQAIPHWRVELNAWINEIERLTPDVGKKTAAEWNQRITGWRDRMGGS